MAQTILNLQIRNYEAARVLQNLANQNLTVTFTFTAAQDLSSGVIGSLTATTVAVNYPPEVGPVGTTPNIAANPQSN
jgi:ABC-type uncharacterized transport system YnjBCD substrate-binding protein